MSKAIGLAIGAAFAYWLYEQSQATAAAAASAVLPSQFILPGSGSAVFTPSTNGSGIPIVPIGPATGSGAGSGSNGTTLTTTTVNTIVSQVFAIVQQINALVSQTGGSIPAVNNAYSTAHQAYMGALASATVDAAEVQLTTAQNAQQTALAAIAAQQTILSSQGGGSAATSAGISPAFLAFWNSLPNVDPNQSTQYYTSNGLIVFSPPNGISGPNKVVNDNVGSAQYQTLMQYINGGG